MDRRPLCGPGRRRARRVHGLRGTQSQSVRITGIPAGPCRRERTRAKLDPKGWPKTSRLRGKTEELHLTLHRRDVYHLVSRCQTSQPRRPPTGFFGTRRAAHHRGPALRADRRRRIGAAGPWTDRAATQNVNVLALRSGSELDSAKPLPAALGEARDRVARDFALPAEWLNPGPTDLLEFGLPEGFVDRLERRDHGDGLTSTSPRATTRSTSSSTHWSTRVLASMRPTSGRRAYRRGAPGSGPVEPITRPVRGLRAGPASGARTHGSQGSDLSI